MASATVSSHSTSPNVLNWMTRVRIPLIALTVALVAVDAIGLGLRWADASNNAIADVTPRVLQPRIAAPDAVVSSSDKNNGESSSALVDSANTSANSYTPVLIGPVAPPVVSPTVPGAPTAPSTPVAPAVPLAQVDLAIPGVAQVSLGLGDGSCTTIDLTLIALGGCPAPSGSGPVILHLGGSLLGQNK